MSPMSPEGLEAITTKTMRPSALDAVANARAQPHVRQLDGQDADEAQPRPVEPPPTAPPQPATPLGERTDGTESAAKLVEDVVHGVKAAVDGAIAWAGKKADQLSSGDDSQGPYASPATCMPTDLDPIASGILPAMPAQDSSAHLQEGQTPSSEPSDKVQKPSSDPNPRL